MIVRFDIRCQPSGWNVIDTVTGEPARVGGLLPEALDEEEAAEIADLLNTLHFLRCGAVVH